MLKLPLHQRLALSVLLGFAMLVQPLEGWAVEHSSQSMRAPASSRTIKIAPGVRAVDVIHQINLQRGLSALLQTSFDIKRVSVSDPSIADVVVIGGREIQLIAKNAGDTSLLIWEDGHLQAMIDVHISTVDTHVIAELKRVLNNPTIEVDVAGQSLILRGHVATIQEHEQATMIATAFLENTRTSEGARDSAVDPNTGDAEVINLLEVGGNHQVMIEVVIAELRKEFSHAFGINLFAAIQIDEGKQATFQTLLKNMTSNPEMMIAPGPQGMTEMTEAVTMAGTFFSEESLDVRLFFEAVEANQLGTILAEPTVIARSGSMADFLVGGEVPIPIITSNDFNGARYSIVFKKFGVNVMFTPTVMSDEQIHLQVTSEVSEPDFQYGVRVLGSAVPAFQTRRVNTSVELKDGQTFIVAGLLREDRYADYEALPWLGQVPILGQLFRSRVFQKNLTELVMVITPRLVRPAGPEPIELPTDFYIEPTRKEFYWSGKIEGSPPPLPPSPITVTSPHPFTEDAPAVPPPTIDRGAVEADDDWEPEPNGGISGQFGHRVSVPMPRGVN